MFGNDLKFIKVVAGRSFRTFGPFSQDSNVSDTTIANYFQIFEGFLIISRIDPLIKHILSVALLNLLSTYFLIWLFDNFLKKYEEAEHGYIVCRTPQHYQITDKISAILWQEITMLFSK